MCISKIELNSKVKELRQYKRILEETGAIIDQLETEIKNYMDEEHADTLTGDDYKITWKEYLKNSFDSKSFKADQPEIYNRYVIKTSYKKFLLK